MAISTNVARLAVDWYGGAPPPREEFDFGAGVSLGVLVVNTLSVAVWHILCRGLGRPLGSLIASLAFCLITFLRCSETEEGHG